MPNLRTLLLCSAFLWLVGLLLTSLVLRGMPCTSQCYVQHISVTTAFITGPRELDSQPQSHHPSVCEGILNFINQQYRVAAGLLPLDTAGSQATALILGVGFQEGIRYGCFLLHRQALH